MITYVPSVSALRSSRTLAKTPPPSQRQLLAFADPIFAADRDQKSPPAASCQARLQVLRGQGAIGSLELERLPETADEARRAAQTLGGREEDLFLQLRTTEHNMRTPLSGPPSSWWTKADSDSQALSLIGPAS
jgi:hypothetical protein